MARGYTGPDWTTEIPSVSGYYWMRTPLGLYPDGEPVEVKTDGTEDECFMCYSIGNEMQIFRNEVTQGTEWFGPIAPPK